MAKKIREAFRRLVRRISYPRSVFDMRPMDRTVFPRETAEEALRSDWQRVANDLYVAATRVYCDG